MGASLLGCVFSRRKLGPDCSPIVGAQILAGDLSSSGALDGDTPYWRQRSFARHPRSNISPVRVANSVCQGSLPTNNLGRTLHCGSARRSDGIEFTHADSLIYLDITGKYS